VPRVQPKAAVNEVSGGAPGEGGWPRRPHAALPLTLRIGRGGGARRPPATSPAGSFSIWNFTSKVDPAPEARCVVRSVALEER
jgi:hypothetical protein